MYRSYHHPIGAENFKLFYHPPRKQNVLRTNSIKNNRFMLDFTKGESKNTIPCLLLYRWIHDDPASFESQHILIYRMVIGVDRRMVESTLLIYLEISCFYSCNFINQLFSFLSGLSLLG